MKGVINIGAHQFEEYKTWVKEGAANFLLFEPVEANFIYLLENFHGENIKMMKVALGNYTGEAEMYIDTNHRSLSASLLTPTDHLSDYPDIIFDQKETARVDKLDNIDYDRNLYDHIYITAQGMELEIFRGAEKSLKHIKTIKSQTWRKRLYEGSFITKELTEYLSGIGFVLKQIIPRGISWDHAIYERTKR
jgi:FkbM family methyltransferase